MYVCQKKSTDGGKTWGKLTYPFGREVANREASPVYDFIHDKLVVVANLMDSQLIMVQFSTLLFIYRLFPMMKVILTLLGRTSMRRSVLPTQPMWALVTVFNSAMVLIVVVL